MARSQDHRLRGIVLFGAIVAVGVAGAAIFFGRDRDPSREEAEPATDASADARVANAKKKGGKNANKTKPTKGRGGTTRVAPRGAGGGGAAAGGGAGGTSAAGTNAAGTSVAGGGDESNAGGGPPAAVKRGGGGPRGPSFESALAHNDEQVTIGGQTNPDLTDAQISAPMRDGSFVGDCGAPDDMGVTVKVAIRMGRAVGVSVSTDPPDSDVAGCIDRHVRGLSWPANPKTDSFVTTY